MKSADIATAAVVVAVLILIASWVVLRRQFPPGAPKKSRRAESVSFANLNNDPRCYVCPKGMERTIFSYDDPEACAPGGSIGINAIILGDAPRYCKQHFPGSFADADGSCWKCPRDYRRSAAPVTSKAACAKSAGLFRIRHSPAAKAGEWTARASVICSD